MGNPRNERHEIGTKEGNELESRLHQAFFSNLADTLNFLRFLLITCVTIAKVQVRGAIEEIECPPPREMDHLPLGGQVIPFPPAGSFEFVVDVVHLQRGTPGLMPCLDRPFLGNVLFTLRVKMPSLHRQSFSVIQRGNYESSIHG